MICPECEASTMRKDDHVWFCPRCGYEEQPLNDLETKIVELIESGYVRWKIAEEVGLGETTVREVIRSLCERFDVPMRDLPEAVKEAS